MTAQVSKIDFDIVLKRYEEVVDELRQAYKLLDDTNKKYIAETERANRLALELGPLRFNNDHIERLRREHRLIEMDFAAEPKSRNWLQSPNIKKLIANFSSSSDSYISLLKKFSSFKDRFSEIETTYQSGSDVLMPHWDNGWFPGLDGVALYSFVASNNPRIYLEVGSGNSTKFVYKAIRDHSLRTKIVSIDPFPREEIDQICDEIHRVKFEDSDLGIFDTLTAEDIVFIDNSHRSLPNSDVTVFFMEVLGRLPPGILYGIHDIFLPYDYAQEWAPRYYNEQYLLASYLFGGADGDEIVLPCGYISREPSILSTLDEVWHDPKIEKIVPEGGAFWMRRAEPGSTISGPSRDS